MLQLVVLCILFSLVYGQSGFGDCQRVTTQADFNATLYFGTWYDIAHFPFYEEENSACITARYSPKADGHVDVLNSERVGGINGTLESAEGDAYAPDPTQPAKLAVSFYQDVFRAPYWVVKSDYETYSAVFSCTSIAGLYHFEYAWILSRTPTLPPTTISALIQIFQSYQIDTSSFVYTVQQGCW